MNVLILQPSCLVYGGAELAITKLCNYLLDKGHNVDLLTMNIDKRMEEDLHSGLGLISFKDNKVPYDPFSYFREYLEKNYSQYDIFNSHNHPCELLVKKEYGPHVWYHNEPPDYVLDGKKLDYREKEYVNNNVDKILVADKFNQERVFKLYGIRPKIVPYGVDISFWDPSKARPERIEKEYNILKEDFLILHPGWYHYRKNQLYTFRIGVNLLKRIPNLKILFSGQKTPYLEVLRKQVRDQGLDDFFIFDTIMGKRERVRDMYARANLVVFPYKSQGGFLSIFESIAMNKTILVSPEVCCSSIVRQNNLGIVTGDFYSYIVKIYKDPDKFKFNERTWVKNNLTWEQYNSKILKAFEELI